MTYTKEQIGTDISTRVDFNEIIWVFNQDKANLIPLINFLHKQCEELRNKDNIVSETSELNDEQKLYNDLSILMKGLGVLDYDYS